MKDNEELIENGAVEIFEENSVITLYNDKDEPIDFYEIASIEYNEKFYELLQPVGKIEGIEEDEAVIFEYVVEDGSEEKNFIPIYDEELLSNVFEVYLRAVADYSYDDCGCDCHSCDECNHGHEHAQEQDCSGGSCDFKKKN